MEFCSKCGSLLYAFKKKDKIFAECKGCGFIKELDKGITSSEKITKKENKGKGSVNDKNELATYTHTCKKCGHNKAQIIEVGVFYSDEDNLTLLRCEKCGYSERIGRKVA